jgi:hypothetical protein
MDPNGQWTLQQGFSPDQQQLYNQYNQLATAGLGAASGFFSDPANYSRIDYQGPSYQYNGGSRDAAEKAIYERGARYLDPQYEKSQQQLQDRLTAMGFNINDPGAKEQMDQFSRGKERAYADLRDSAIVGGGQEATMELQRALAAEGARTGFLRNERSDMVALLNALKAGGSPQPGWGMPQSQYGTPGMPPINSMAPQYASWNAQQAAGANNQAGWWGLGNTFLNSTAGQNTINGIYNGLFG